MSFLEPFSTRVFHEVTGNSLRDKEVGILELLLCYSKKKLHSTWIYMQGWVYEMKIKKGIFINLYCLQEHKYTKSKDKGIPPNPDYGGSKFRRFYNNVFPNLKNAIKGMGCLHIIFGIYE